MLHPLRCYRHWLRWLHPRRLLFWFHPRIWCSWAGDWLVMELEYVLEVTLVVMVIWVSAAELYFVAKYVLSS